VPDVTERASVAFDRAVEYYDRTRAIPDDALRATIDRLSGELEGRGRCLEIGVGTGILALELHGRGVPMAGLDLSEPMLRKLVEKAGGSPPFPLALGDVRALPFRDGVFGGAVARWVFHLVPGWERAVDELARVVRPGGTVLVNLGDFHATWEIVDRFLTAAGGVPFAVGLDPRDPGALDAALARHGASVRLLEPIRSGDDTTVGAFLDEMANGQHSWSWRVPAGDRARAIPEVRAWAWERFGSLDAPIDPELRIVWRAYGLPG
jgi:ubiquinone/menaquinone biosynthesis C-methylase UbiE